MAQVDPLVDCAAAIPAASLHAIVACPFGSTVATWFSTLGASILVAERAFPGAVRTRASSDMSPVQLPWPTPTKPGSARRTPPEPRPRARGSPRSPMLSGACNASGVGSAARRCVGAARSGGRSAGPTGYPGWATNMAIRTISHQSAAPATPTMNPASASPRACVDGAPPRRPPVPPAAAHRHARSTIATVAMVTVATDDVEFVPTVRHREIAELAPARSPRGRRP